MHWLREHPDAGPTQAFPLSTDDAWTSGAIPEYIYGHYLNDVLSYLVPFYTDDLFPPAHRNATATGAAAAYPEGAWTVADLLCYTQLDTAPYTYDTLVTPTRA